MSNKWKNSASLATIIVASGLTTSAFAPTALAGGMEPTYKPPAPVAATTNWKGFYVGSTIGAAQSNWSGCFECTSTDSARVFMEDLGETGILAGFHAGYNWQRGRTVFGIEGDVSFMDLDGVAEAPSSTEQATSELDTLASVRGRIGVTVGDAENVLLYAALGVAWSDAEVTVYTSGRNSTTRATFDFDDVGVTLASGFEYAMSDKFRLRVEGAYYWFDDSQNILSGGAFTGDTGDFVELEDVVTIKVGGSFYFNGPERVAYK